MLLRGALDELDTYGPLDAEIVNWIDDLLSDSPERR